MGYYCEIHTINNTLVRVCMSAVNVTKGFFRFKYVVNVAITSLRQNDDLLILSFLICDRLIHNSVKTIVLLSLECHCAIPYLFFSDSIDAHRKENWVQKGYFFSTQHLDLKAHVCLCIVLSNMDSTTGSLSVVLF